MQFKYGTLSKEIPPEFVPVEVWPEYGYIAAPPSFCKREHPGGKLNILRWSAWPLTFEQHVGDETPDLRAVALQGDLAYTRWVTWKRVKRTDVPQGWLNISKKPSQIDGFKSLTGDVFENWHKNARRDMRLWRERHEGKTHVFEQVDLETYKRAYSESLTAKHIDNQRPKDLARRLSYPVVKANTELWVIRQLSNGTAVAGTAIIYSPTYKSSTHFAPFIHEDGRRVFGATALMAHWFLRAKARGDSLVVTTNFWMPGKPKDWKGFSEFKSHFGWQYIAYPPELGRFVRGKLF